MANLQNYFKVNVDGGGVEVTTIFNPFTLDEKSIITFDIDDVRVEYERSEYRELPYANDVICRQWKHTHKSILEGDEVKVVKGRKVKIGTISRVTKISGYYDYYGRKQATYVFLENGEKTNICNCELFAPVDDVTTIKPNLDNMVKITTYGETEKAYKLKEVCTSKFDYIAKSICYVDNSNIYAPKWAIKEKV